MGTTCASFLIARERHLLGVRFGDAADGLRVTEQRHVDSSRWPLRRRHGVDGFLRERNAVFADGNFRPSNQPDAEPFTLAAEGALVLVHGNTLEANAQDRHLYGTSQSRANAE